MPLRRETVVNPSITSCCVPNGCSNGSPIHMEDLSGCVKVICNNDHCTQGRYMHKNCFEQWEAGVLTYLRSTGRARSWSEKQRLQNLWTKRGYDLAYKVCGCKCSKGHLRKDLDWTPPSTVAVDINKKKPKKKKKGNDKPSLIISTSVVVSKQTPTSSARMRTSSMSSTGSYGSGGASPPITEASPALVESPVMKKFWFCDAKKDRDRHGSGSIFSRRIDYTPFKFLPKHKINPYHIRFDKDNGNDEIRCFILSTLSANRINRVSCVLCHGTLVIFDRYPLIDGSFFLSPRKHSKSSVPCNLVLGNIGDSIADFANIKSNRDSSGSTSAISYLNAVCIGCMQGWNVSMKCKFCNIKWDGKHLILGSMYSYDIFAAIPCCADRLKCNNCGNLVIPGDRRTEYFCYYSRPQRCSHCSVVDHHFAKSLNATFVLFERE